MTLKLRTTEKLTIIFAILATLFSLLGAWQRNRRGASPLLGIVAAICSAGVGIAALMAARARERAGVRAHQHGSMPPAP
jgi:hypothetical protein